LFYSDWDEAKKKLESQLPQTFDGLKPEMRPHVRTAIVDFLTSIKQQNAEFLKLCIDKIRREDALQSQPEAEVLPAVGRGPIAPSGPARSSRRSGN
jgi:hypothetical protein